MRAEFAETPTHFKMEHATKHQIYLTVIKLEHTP